MDLKVDLKRYLKIEKLKEVLSDENKRLYIILGSAVVFSLLYIVFFIGPATGSVMKVSRAITDIKNNVDLVNNRLGRLEEMKAKLTALREEYEGYSAQLPAQKEISRFLEGLASTAKSSDVNILSVTPMELEPAKGGDNVKYYSALPVVIAAKSGYHQLGKFINDLEKGSRFTTIQDLRINYDSKMPRRHDINMVLKVYVSTDEGANAKK
jgi:Tfp pilus assembly protein PilO